MIARGARSRRAYPAALQMLARRRLTEAQLTERLARRGHDEADIRAAVERCRADGFLDDRLFARLYVEGRARAVGDARLVAELVRRGIERTAAVASVAEGAPAEDDRLAAAVERLFRTRPEIAYPSAARALERLAFPTAAIYRHLRAHASRWRPLEPSGDIAESAGGSQPHEVGARFAGCGTD